MAQENSSATPKKKGGIWFFIVPILLIGFFILFKTFPIGINGKLISNLSTKFTPEELGKLIDNFNVNKVAGECANKGFVKFDNTDTLMCQYFEKQTDLISFYYFKENVGPNKKQTYYEKREKLLENMKEGIVPVDELNCILYIIKDKNNYEKFIEYLSNKNKNTDNGIGKINKNINYYIDSNACFINCEYNENFDGYCICVFSSNNLKYVLAFYNNGQDDDKITGEQAYAAVSGNEAALKTASLQMVLVHLLSVKKY